MLISNLYIDKYKFIVVLIGLISGIGYGYYSRSYLGYFDTDVLNTFFPMMILYGMLATIKYNSIKFLFIVVVSDILYLYWYHSSEPLVYSLNGLFLLYCLIFYFKDIFKNKYILLLLISILILVLFNIDISQFQHHANRYIFKQEILNQGSFKFVAPMQLVAEAIDTNILYIVKLISGNLFIFILSFIGYLLLVFKHKEMILALPMIVLGFLSVEAGVRFHIYAIPMMVISYFYFIYYLSSKFDKKLSIALISFLFLFTVYENYKSVKYWNTKIAYPVFMPEQVSALKKLESISNLNDYAVSWWDYGWPIEYYTNLKTLIDNGRHHEDNYTVAHIL